MILEQAESGAASETALVTRFLFFSFVFISLVRRGDSILHNSEASFLVASDQSNNVSVLSFKAKQSSGLSSFKFFPFPSVFSFFPCVGGPPSAFSFKAGLLFLFQYSFDSTGFSKCLATVTHVNLSLKIHVVSIQHVCYAPSDDGE